MIITYVSKAERHLRSLERTSAKPRRKAILLTNRGTIINTSPTLGRNTLVSVDGGTAIKLKRSSLARQPKPTTTLPNRKAR